MKRRARYFATCLGARCGDLGSMRESRGHATRSSGTRDMAVMGEVSVYAGRELGAYGFVEKPWYVPGTRREAFLAELERRRLTGAVRFAEAGPATDADLHAGGRLLVLGGGGYALEGTARGWVAVVEALLAS